MNITQERVDDLNSIITIQLKKDDYLEKVEKSIREQSKKAKMPGFRPGMVPAGHIKRLYGKSILVDEVNNLLSKSLNEYIEANKIQILGYPLPSADEDHQPNWDFEDDFEFKYELGLAPEFDFPLGAADKIKTYSVYPDEETLLARIKNLRRAYGKMSNPEVSEDGDVIYADFQQLSQDGSLYPEGITNTASLRLDLVKDEVSKKKLIGLKKDDVLDLDLQKALDKNAHQISHLLNIDEESAAQLSSSFRLTVKNVNRLDEADLNEEFYLKIYPDGDVTTEDVFRERVKEEISSMTQNQVNKKLETDIVEFLVKKFPSSLPDQFLKKWLKAANEERFSPDQIDEQYDDFQKNLKWTLIENKILKEQNIETTPEEILVHAKKKLSDQYKMYSPVPLPENQLAEYAVKMIQDREQASRIFEEVRAAKAFEFIKSVVTLDKKEIPYNEFIKL